jgi:hypothetical protein
VTEERAESGLATRSRVCGSEIVTGGEYSRGDKTLESKWEQLAAREKENGPLVREREGQEDRRKWQERKERGEDNIGRCRGNKCQSGALNEALIWEREESEGGKKRVGFKW